MAAYITQNAASEAMWLTFHDTHFHNFNTKSLIPCTCAMASEFKTHGSLLRRNR